MGDAIYAMSRWLARLGALVLVLIAALTVCSVIGRALAFAGLGPVPGDFELVEAGTALSVFCFLPWCHLNNGHAMVDLLWQRYSPAMQRVLASGCDALMLLVWLLLVWRMGVAMLDYRDNGEVSFILQMPVWWGYAASFVPACEGCVVYAWCLLETLRLVRAPRGFVLAGSAH